jgi:halimadienyl-diphosphate synthase
VPKRGSPTDLNAIRQTDYVSPAPAAAPSLDAEAAALLGALKTGTMSAVAYDTAFLARLRKPGSPDRLAYPDTIRWLLRAQNADGSFGTTLPVPKERVIATVSAVLALAVLPPGEHAEAAHRARLAALTYLFEKTSDWQAGLTPVGFEQILPTLMEEGRALQLPLPFDRFAGVAAQREAKLGHIPPTLIYKMPTLLLHSLEYLGGQLDVTAAAAQLSSNGSFGNSPSATAAFLERGGKDPRAWAYLDSVVATAGDGGVPDVTPFEVFERAWVLYNLRRGGIAARDTERHVRYLASSLTDDGVGCSVSGLRPDADDTAVTLTVLQQHGQAVTAGPLRSFEGIDYFHTFPLEREPSPTVNAHVLEAIAACQPFPTRASMQQKVVRFLRDQRVDGAYWVDKWHGSPFYATARVVFALTASAPDLCRPALRWLCESQRSDGSWGWFQEGTAEETAYAVQAWLTAPAAERSGLRVDLARAEAFLRTAHTQPRPALWVGKGLYTPLHIVESAILSARNLLRGQHTHV